VVRTRNYNLIAIILIAISIAVAGFAAVQFTSKNAQQQSANNSKLAQLGKDKKPKLKPDKHDATIQASALLSPSEEQEDDLPVVHKSGVLTEDETWISGNVYIVDNYLEIDAGRTLTVEPGAIIKMNNSANYYGLTVYGGTVNMNGTETSPIVVTSLHDDSIGGDSDGNGTSVGSFGDYFVGINLYDGNVNVDNAIFQYGYRGINANLSYSSTAQLNITNSLLKSTTYLNNCPTGAVAMKGNEISVASSYGQYGIQVAYTSPWGIDLSGSDKNVFTGQGMGRVLYLGNSSSIDPGESWDIDGSTGVVAILQESLYVSGVLNVSGGAIVKLNAPIQVSGMVNISSTQAKNVFTSLSDDSAGGDSNGDGNSQGSSYVYSVAFRSIAGSILNISNADIRHADAAITSGTYSNSGCSSGDIHVYDSILYSPIQNTGCGSFGTLDLKRNIFTTTGRPAISVGSINPSGIILTGADRNSFEGDDIGREIYLFNGGSYNHIDLSDTWNISGEKGAVLVIQGTIKNYGALSARPGTVMKIFNTIGFINQSSGNVNFEGDNSHRIVVTSYRDDSVGGDSDGELVNPNPNYIAFENQGGNINLNSIDIKYAEMPLSMNSGTADFRNTAISNTSLGIYVLGGNMILRGQLNDASAGIHACNWGTSNCSVDASYTDWGSASGPNASSQTLVCGQVTIAPWTYNGGTVNGGLFGSGNCDNSPTPDQNLNSATQNYSSRMATRGIDCSNGFQDACNAMETAQTCLSAAVNLAGSTSPFPLPNSDPYDAPAAWGGTLANSATTYIQAIESPTPQLSALQFGNSLLGALNTIVSIANAYNTCAP